MYSAAFIGGIGSSDIDLPVEATLEATLFARPATERYYVLDIHRYPSLNLSVDHFSGY
ncbi:MAG: hypothetical protein CM1200mP38_8490 [Dehalococcoidia bacterium]|nr:MAG: hypothetical protein CM1200mP38_8490 [Dehalococcoidia bacterium]